MTFIEQFDQAKQIGTIPFLWGKMGYPGEPKDGVMSAPWRADKNPSFQIFAKGMGWKDYAEGIGGDGACFIERACGLTRKEAMHKLVELTLGIGATVTPVESVPEWKEAPLNKTRNRPEIPPFLKPCDCEAQVEQLSKLRGISVDGLRYAMEAGLLGFANYKGFSAWFVMDEARCNIQARRMDGTMWRFKKDGEVREMKSWTLTGSWASWPLGIGRSKPGSKVYLCEGGPDMIAACHWASDDESIIPVGILGAAQNIHPGAIPLFYRSHVTIFQHNEPAKPKLVNGEWVMAEHSAGEAAALKWTEQIKDYASSVKVFTFPEDVKDLNDFLIMGGTVE
jgi:hypothetical protein